MRIRILVLTLVLQVLLVSSETVQQQQQQPNKNEESGASRISTIPLRSEKAPRFIIRRARPHLVTYNIVKTPLQSLGINNRNDNGAILTVSSQPTAAAARADVLNATASAVEENSKSKVESTLQSKSDVIDYGSLNDERLYQQQVQQQQYQTQSLYDYNTMHSSSSPYQVSGSGGLGNQQQERGQFQKYGEAPKLEYLHAYQFTDEIQDPVIPNQELVDEVEYPKHRLSPQLQHQLHKLQNQNQNQQPQVSEVEISKSKQYSYTIRKPEHSQFHSSSFHQPQAQNTLHQLQQQQQQPQAQALYQTQPPQHQFANFGRETAYLKQTPSTVVPQHQHQEEFKFRINRPTVEKEFNFDEDTKPVHIHHHYPVQHTEEAEQSEIPPIQQVQPQFSHSPSAPVRNQFYPSAQSNSVKGQYSTNQFQINAAEPESTQKPYNQGYQNNHQSFIPARKPNKPWQEQSPVYDVPTTTKAPPKWENPHAHPQHQHQNQNQNQNQHQNQPQNQHPIQHQNQNQQPIDNTKAPLDEEERERAQVVYGKDIRIEIPEEEIYKHIQNSVHQIIRDLKEKRTKDQNRGKPLAGQDQSWSKFIMQDENRAEKHQRHAFNKSAPAFDSFAPKPIEKSPFAPENNNAAEEKPRDQGFQQFHHQHQQPHHFHHSSQRINSRQHEEEKPYMGSNKNNNPNNHKFNPFRFEENYSAPAPNTGRITDATQYENGYPRDTVSTTVDITMKNPKKAPQIDLNALDVGQTWNHDSHFESQEFKNDHTQAYFTRNNPAPSSTSSQYHIQPAHFSNFTNNPFTSTTHQPFYEQSRDSRDSRPRVQPQANFHQDNTGNSMSYVSQASMHVKDPFPMRSATPTPAFFKASQPVAEPEVPEVDIMHGLLPVVNQFTDNGQRLMKVILDPSKMPRELVSHDAPQGQFQQDFGGQLLPGNVQTIQYNMNHQHMGHPQFMPKQQQQQQNSNNFPNQNPEQQQNYIHSYPKERKNKQSMSAWANNIPEGSANVIQFLPPPPLPASRSLLPYDSYSPIYNEDLSLGKAISSTIMRNKRHRGSEEYKKMIRTTYPRNSKKVKTVKILEPSTEMKPPPKFNKFSKKSSSA